MDSNSIKKGVLIIVLIFFALSLSILINAFNKNFYNKIFSELDVEKNLDGAKFLHAEVMDFLTYRTNDLSDSFNNREISHMHDVRKLMTIVFFVMIVSLILMIFLLRCANYDTLFNSGYIIIIISLLLLMVVMFRFDTFFESLHKMLFKPDTWLFNPAFEKLVVLYPEKLFLSLGNRIAITFLFIGNLYILFGLTVKTRCQLDSPASDELLNQELGDPEKKEELIEDEIHNRR